MRPCRKDLCLIYSLGVDYARLIEFTNQNPTGRLFRRAERAVIYARRLSASWYGYDTGILLERALRRILRWSINYCRLIGELGLNSEYCRRYTYYDDVLCEPVSEYDVEVAYSRIIHIIANYNDKVVSKLLTEMTRECSTYEVRW